MKTVSVAIDGPSGAGKSTLARKIADALGYVYVDTGAIYRSIGYDMIAHEIDVKDEQAVVERLPKLHVELTYGEDGLQHMLVNKEDVTEKIRTPEVSMAASVVSAYPAVREYLLDMQRQLAQIHHVVMDGRDIGTVVLPEATVKIFLTATAEERARRRMLELQQRGMEEPFEKVLKEIEERDYHDMHRAAAPLRQAEDAVLLDTTELNFQESEQALLWLVRERIGA